MWISSKQTLEFFDIRVVRKSRSANPAPQREQEKFPAVRKSRPHCTLAFGQKDKVKFCENKMGCCVDCGWSALVTRSDRVNAMLSVRRQAPSTYQHHVASTARMHISCGCILAGKQTNLLYLNGKQRYLSDVGRVQLKTDSLRSVLPVEVGCNRKSLFSPDSFIQLPVLQESAFCIQQP